MMSQTGQQVITIHILSNISRSKANKISSVNKTAWKIFFLKKSYWKWGTETNSRPLFAF